MMLYLSAIQVGQMKGTLTAAEADQLRGELSSLPLAIAETVSANEERIKKLAEDWADASEFVFVGSGPNYGTALFSAAKILEASGDPALGQAIEEWAHLQYFAREPRTPTFFIVPEGRSSDRAGEIAVAAKTIGRRVVAIVPEGEQTISAQADVVLPVMEGVREAFSPLLYCLASELFAAYRAQVLIDALRIQNLSDYPIDREVEPYTIASMAAVGYALRCAFPDKILGISLLEHGAKEPLGIARAIEA